MLELLEDLNYLIMRKIRKINYLKLDENKIQKICSDIHVFYQIMKTKQSEKKNVKKFGNVCLK